MEPISDFISRFESSVTLDDQLIVKKQNRYFLVNEALRPRVQKDFFYAGAYLGKFKDRIFFPSFILLAMMAVGKANNTVVDKKTAWLFICGRDVFKRGILNIMGSRRKGSYTLVLNQYNECLGFGKIQRNISEEKDKNQVIIKNISNIGDFLKREK
jgi:predicted ribosome-associated RNA-binding protein Tma20